MVSFRGARKLSSYSVRAKVSPFKQSLEYGVVRKNGVEFPVKLLKLIYQYFY